MFASSIYGLFHGYPIANHLYEQRNGKERTRKDKKKKEWVILGHSSSTLPLLTPLTERNRKGKHRNR